MALRCVVIRRKCQSNVPCGKIWQDVRKHKELLIEKIRHEITNHVKGGLSVNPSLVADRLGYHVQSARGDSR